MERPPRTKPAARNTMRVTIKTPPDKKHSPHRDAEKQPPRSPPRRSPSRSATTNKLTIRERFILSFSIPLILVSLGLLMFIAGHVIARMVGRAKARKAERIATAYVEVLNVSLQSTATTEAATAIAAETTSLDATALLNASQSVVASGTVPVFIDIYVRKGHRLGGGWRSITVAPKILDDYYPVPSLDDAVAPGTIRSDADLKGAVTPVELATIVDDYDRGRAIGLDGTTTSTTAARVMGSARRDYISKGTERTDASWKTTSVRTTAETKMGDVTSAEGNELGVSGNAKPSGKSVTPAKGARDEAMPAKWSTPGAFTEDFFDPYHNRDEGTGPSPKSYLNVTPRAPSSTTVLQAASLFDVPPIDDDVLVGTETTDVHTAQNRSAFITAIDQIDIVDPVSVLIITRAQTSSEAESKGTPIGTTSAAITPAELVAIQQALVPVETGAPLVTSTPVKASEQPQESTTGTMDVTTESALTSVTLERHAQFETTTTTETPGKMVTAHMLIEGYGATPKDEQSRSGSLFSSTEPAPSGAVSQIEMFVVNETIGSATRRSNATSSSPSQDQSAASGSTQVAITKNAAGYNNQVEQRNTGSFLSEVAGTVSRVSGATNFHDVTNESSTEKSRSTIIGNESTSSVHMVATTGNRTVMGNAADEADAGTQTRWSSETNDAAPSDFPNDLKAESIVSRIYSAIESSHKTFPESGQGTARNGGSPITNEYGCTIGRSLYTKRDALSKSTNGYAMSIHTPTVDRGTYAQIEPVGTGLTTARTTSTRRPSTATVRAKMILAGFTNVGSLFTNRDSLSMSTNVHAISISTPLVGHDAPVKITLTDTDLTRKHATRTREMIADATLKAKTMLPGYFRNGTRVNLATVVPVGEPTVPIFSEIWASRNQRKALSNTAVSETSRIPKGVGTPVPSTRLNSFEGRSAVRSPSTRTQLRGDRLTTTASPIVRIGTKHREATIPSDVQSSRDSTGRYAIIPAMTIQSAVTGDRGTPTTKPATSTRETRMPSSTRHSAFDDRTSTPRKKSSTFPTPSSAAGTQNGRESGGIDTTTTAWTSLGDRSIEASAVTMASAVSPSENRTYPAWRINSALNANASPITAGGKTPVVDSANASPSDVKSITAWRIRTASPLHSASLTASAARARDDARPRSYSQDSSAAISPAMIIQSAMTRNGATTTAKPKTTILVPVPSFGVKAPPTRLNNSDVRTSAQAAGMPLYTTVFETRRFSQDEVNATDKRIRPVLPIRPALTTHPMQVIARSSAVFRGSSPAEYTRTTGPAARTFPAMLIEAAVKGTGVSKLAKRATDHRETLVHNLVNMEYADRNPIRTVPVGRTTVADTSDTPPVKARRENPRRTEERASSSKTATAWRIADAIRMRNPRPAVRSRPVNDTSTSGRD